MSGFYLTRRQAERFDDFLLSGKKPYQDHQSQDPGREAAFLRGVVQATEDTDFDSLPRGEQMRQEAKYKADLHFAKFGEVTAELQYAVDYARGYHHCEVYLGELWFSTCNGFSFEPTDAQWDALQQNAIASCKKWASHLKPFDIPLFASQQGAKQLWL